MTLHSACAQHHTLVPVVNDLWVCECPAVYKKQGKLWLDPARAGLLDAILKLCQGQEGIRHQAKVLEDQNAGKASESRPEVISGYVK